MMLNRKLIDEYCTTRHAAEMLGLSLGTVQQMVESGALAAWKTEGGHRRVSVASVKEQLRKRAAIPSQPRGAELSVLIAEDDPILQALYAANMAKWGLPIAVQIVSNGFEGLVQIGQQAPDVLILDLMMPGLDGFEMLRTLRANPVFSDMDIIVVSAMSADSVEERGGLPADVTLYGKPVPFQQLHGYLQAKVAQRQRGMAQDD